MGNNKKYTTHTTVSASLSIVDDATLLAWLNEGGNRSSKIRDALYVAMNGADTPDERLDKILELLQNVNFATGQDREVEAAVKSGELRALMSSFL